MYCIFIVFALSEILPAPPLRSLKKLPGVRTERTRASQTAVFVARGSVYIRASWAIFPRAFLNTPVLATAEVTQLYSRFALAPEQV